MQLGRMGFASRWSDKGKVTMEFRGLDTFYPRDPLGYREMMRHMNYAAAEELLVGDIQLWMHEWIPEHRDGCEFVSI